MKNKLQGCLIGAAIGDSVGLPYEGMSSSTGKKLFGLPNKQKLLFGLGMVSDDTEHLVIVLRSYKKANGDADKNVR
ncbi:MAG: ADP-ribosylglycohydrolase family protein [Pelagibacterales bacterium]|nr:ADP-ribosylglycohydrolase family protein [Pelagibacterales bacterium]